MERVYFYLTRGTLDQLLLLFLGNFMRVNRNLIKCGSPCLVAGLCTDLGHEILSVFQTMLSSLHKPSSNFVPYFRSVVSSSSKTSRNMALTWVSLWCVCASSWCWAGCMAWDAYQRTSLSCLVAPPACSGRSAGLSYHRPWSW